jgi:hypothetical protein
VEATRIADSETLLGLLQRGRGKGRLDALATSGDSAAAAVVECVTRDPRTDRQVEDRDEYYGRCAFAIDLDISPVEASLYTPAEEEDRDDATVLALGTLAWMARLGRRDAVAVLRRYVETGRNWDDAIDFMSNPTPVGLDGLEQIVCSRATSVDELARAMPWRPELPWTGWAKTSPKIAQAFALQREWAAEQKERRRTLRELPTQELLARREVILLRERTAAADKLILHEATRRGSAQERRDALRVLGWQRDTDVFDAAESELRNADDDFNAGSFALFQLLRVAPIARIRGWIGEEGRQGQIALHMVGVWPTQDDGPLLRSVLDHLGDDDWLYRVGDAVDGLAKLREREAVPALEHVFAETTYSYLRHRVARALAATSNTFADGFAVECLWDCEPATRRVGCATSAWTSIEVRERLAELAADPLGDRRVRSTAARRLRALEI